jgi:SAM-dependent methyltransferase
VSSVAASSGGGDRPTSRRLIDEGEGLPELTGGCRHPGGLELSERVVDLAGLPAGAVLLDVGCGDGVTAEHLARRSGLRVVGVDRSAALVREGRDRCSDLDLREGSAERLPLPDASVDAVLAECVLSIVDDPAAAVDEWARVLRPGGRLLVNDLFRRADPNAPRRLLANRGFAVETWEDHSGALARLVWELAGRGALAPAELRGGGGLGYYLCVAKRGRTHDPEGRRAP